MLTTVVISMRHVSGMITPERGWAYDGRHYLVAGSSDVTTREGYGWGLEDVAPAPGLGVVLEVFYDDTTGKFTFMSRTERPFHSP